MCGLCRFLDWHAGIQMSSFASFRAWRVGIRISLSLSLSFIHFDLEYSFFVVRMLVCVPHIQIDCNTSATAVLASRKQDHQRGLTQRLRLCLPVGSAAAACRRRQWPAGNSHGTGARVMRPGWPRSRAAAEGLLLEVDRPHSATIFRLRCDHDQRRVPLVAMTSCHFDWLPSASPMYLSELARNSQALIHSLSLTAGDDGVADCGRRLVDWIGLSALPGLCHRQESTARCMRPVVGHSEFVRHTDVKSQCVQCTVSSKEHAERVMRPGVPRS